MAARLCPRAARGGYSVQRARLGAARSPRRRRLALAHREGGAALLRDRAARRRARGRTATPLGGLVLPPARGRPRRTPASRALHHPAAAGCRTTRSVGTPVSLIAPAHRRRDHRRCVARSRRRVGEARLGAPQPDPGLEARDGRRAATRAPASRRSRRDRGGRQPAGAAAGPRHLLPRRQRLSGSRGW